MRDRAAFESLQSICPLEPHFFENQFDARRKEIIQDLEKAVHRETKVFEFSFGTVAVSQLECPNVMELETDLLALPLHPKIILNLVDPIQATSCLLIRDENLKKWVAEHTELDFQGSRVFSSPPLLRKQLLYQLVNL